MSKTFIDSIHGNIKLGPHLLEFINTSEFQRLVHIKQLGNVHYIYFCATHTRFEHSIGVAYLVGLLLKHLKAEQPELLITDRDIQLIEIAGLCHDIGHGCFSHLFDTLFLNEKLKNTQYKDYIHHEYRSKQIIKHIIQKYKLNYSADEVEFICELLHPNNNFCKKPKFYFEIVANYKSGLDCDKMDYLLRDGKNIGLNLSVDYVSLFNSARVINDTICYPENEAINIFTIFHSRYYMHKKIYNHPTLHAIDLMTTDILNDMDSRYNISSNISDIEKFITYTDNIIELDNFNNDNTIATQILNRIKTRDLYKLFYQFTSSDYEKIKLIEMLAKKHLEPHKDLFIYKLVKLNYNLKNNNPINEIEFYNEVNPNVCFRLKNDSLIMPSYFQEYTFMIFVKSKEDIKNINIEKLVVFTD